MCNSNRRPYNGWNNAKYYSYFQLLHVFLVLSLVYLMLICPSPNQMLFFLHALSCTLASGTVGTTQPSLMFVYVRISRSTRMCQLYLSLSASFFLGTSSNHLLAITLYHTYTHIQSFSYGVCTSMYVCLFVQVCA